VPTEATLTSEIKLKEGTGRLSSSVLEQEKINKTDNIKRNFFTT